ncbi:hypothetical protein [Roseiconus lacunae]|uniref:hypothetical protein n=1 Tax=Roseiconus lacunae TaxID=2605694 RepID=UPI0011F19C76|nr:hypothetical protein [Roseiconus lacunae]
MANLTNARVIWFKGVLFVLLGVLASGVLFTQLTDFRYVVIYAIAIWAFCRAYYFAFYVIEHYVDPRFRFAGLLDFALYAVFGHRPDELPKERSEENGDGRR